MIALIFFLSGVFAAVFTGVFAAWSDFRSMKIPNFYALMIAGAFVPVFFAVHFFTESSPFTSMLDHLILAPFAMAVLTVPLFFMGLIGAADSKLSIAFAFWLGMRGLIPFLFVMSIIGGVLGLASVLIKKYKPFKEPLADSWIDQVQGGANKVPYGIAIFAGALAGFYANGYFSFGLYLQFVG